MDWKTLFLSTKGRIGQKDFWIGIAILTGIWWAAHFVPPFGYLIHVLLIFPFVCLHTKRLHDLGKSGFIQLIPDVVGLVCFIVGVMWLGTGLVSAVARGDGVAVAGLLMGALLLVVLVGLWALVSLGFLLWTGLAPGQPGDNRFGPARPRSVLDNPPAAPPPVEV
ncbi:MAG: hypothetical protein JWP35_2462 [Caulobacter sp.]|nr:hypothetical protein [Caulobacter sp.]